MSFLHLFNEPWDRVPTAWLDTETTGLRPGEARAVQVGISRFEHGMCVGSISELINPGVPIPADATAVHGITDDMVANAPTLAEVFARDDVKALLNGAQPAAYNGPFDKQFLPPFCEDWMWPWIDCLSLVRSVDAYVKGKGRHKLSVACDRHGVHIPMAHDAGCDAQAAGVLFYKLGRKLYHTVSLGQLLCQQRHEEADEWFRFSQWLSRQPPQKTR